MARLTAEERRRLPDSAFAIPEKRAYPIENAAHARDALARSSGKPEEARVRRAVYRRYPEMAAAHRARRLRTAEDRRELAEHNRKYAPPHTKQFRRF